MSLFTKKSVEPREIPFDEAPYFPSVLDDRGREVVSDISLVAVANLRAVTLGERIRRYAVSPKFLQDQNDLSGYDDLEDLPDDVENPMSPYEVRAHDLVERARANRAKELADHKQALIDKENADKAAFRERFLQLQAEGAQPPLPLTGGGGPESAT